MLVRCRPVPLSLVIVGAEHKRAAAEIGADKIGALEGDVTNGGAAQIGILQVGIPQISAIKYRTEQVRMAEVAADQDRLLQVRTGHFGGFEVYLFEREPGKVGAGQICPRSAMGAAQPFFVLVQDIRDFLRRHFSEPCPCSRRSCGSACKLM